MWVTFLCGPQPGRIHTDMRHWIDSMDATLFLKAVDTMGKELLHLKTHPEIFPHQVEESEFLDYVHLMYSSLDDLFTGYIELDNFVDAVHDFYAEKLAPLRDEKRKAWQQWLHNMAPGSGIDQSNMPHLGCIQILPRAGIRIAEETASENIKIVDHINAVRTCLSIFHNKCQPLIDYRGVKIIWSNR